MTLAMTQPAPDYPDADVISLEVDLAEVTAEVPALRLDDVREALISRARPSLGEPYLGLLRQAAQVLRADVGADEMLRALFHDIREPVGVDAYFNFLVNEAGDALALASCAGVTDDQARSLERVEFGQAVCGNVALKRAPVAVADIQASNDRRVQIVKNLGVRAVACHPLMAGDRLLGTLSFASRTRDEFGAEELGFFAAIARAVALSHERSRLARELAAVESELDALGADGIATSTDESSLAVGLTASALPEVAVEESFAAVALPFDRAASQPVGAAEFAEPTLAEDASSGALEAASVAAVDAVPSAAIELSAAAEVTSAPVMQATAVAAESASLAQIEAASEASEAVSPAAIEAAPEAADAALLASIEALPEVADAAMGASVDAAPEVAAAISMASADAADVMLLAAGEAAPEATGAVSMASADAADVMLLAAGEAALEATDAVSIATTEAADAVLLATSEASSEATNAVSAGAAEAVPFSAEVIPFTPREAAFSEAPNAWGDSPIESIEATPVGAEVILFARYAAAVAAVADIPLGLIEAAPVSALEVSPLNDVTATVVSLAPVEAPTAAPLTDAHDAIEAPAADVASAVDIEASAEAAAPADEGPLASGTATGVNEPFASAAAMGENASFASAAAMGENASFASGTAMGEDASFASGAVVGEHAPFAWGAVTAADAPFAASVAAGEGPLASGVDEMPRDEVLALALAATDAPTLEVLALALTVDDPAHHDRGFSEGKVESEITVELCALDLNTVRMPTLETPVLDLTAMEISALDLSPVETVEAPVRATPRAAPRVPAVVDDEAPTVEVKALAIQELEAERAPVDEGDDITFTYVPPT